MKSMRRKEYTCVVCGRKFPEGQGIVIRRAGIELAFHSKACFTRFFRLFAERVDEKEFKRVSRELIKEFEELRKAKIRQKVI
jgi:large subunit ribosomal protein L24e